MGNFHTLTLTVLGLISKKKNQCWLLVTYYFQSNALHIFERMKTSKFCSTDVVDVRSGFCIIWIRIDDGANYTDCTFGADIARAWDNKEVANFSKISKGHKSWMKKARK